ncbi:hypothetical protein [Candidatus Nitrosotenuis sp. DW1]|nr:hypothetical protein [Candidatus Nitrosotenuis sp. DW1]
MSELAYLDQIRIVLSLAMLGIATVSDIKKGKSMTLSGWFLERLEQA